MSEIQAYLASSSPRRQQLLAQIGIDFEVVAVDVEEVMLGNETVEDFVVRLALDKARAGLDKVGQRKDTTIPVLGADTVVVLGDLILGKPRDDAHAMEMLARLSGRQHRVLTAVALVGDRELSCLNVNTVRFRDIGIEERECYVKSGEPLDKAGAYGIQGMAAIFISHMEGSYSGVMGLPLYETGELLIDYGIKVCNTTGS
ncbi:MAG: nucleoside triphosphate pyrophosphatase YhdE [Gammaproteobacteria bacterium]|nr:MAG: nucleoside triphosphate pyrophosphatase YhdE [Gammaproteobacteria bacterium]